MTAPTEPQPNSFSADRPIPNRSSDRLNRSHFAESIARAIAAWKGKDSLVIALYGKWGMGKTSIKNMVLDAVQSTDPRELDFTEFNPWEVANRNQLTELFFDELSRALGRRGTESRRRVVKKMKRYAARLGASAEISILALKFVGWILFGLGALATVLTRSFLSEIIAICLFAIAAALQFSSRLSDQIAELLGAEIGLHRRSLKELKEDLTRELAKLRRPLLVVLDDADRLTPSELQQLVQLVKVNADFPNLVYLLILDREIAADHLKQALSVDGNDYLDKIVQVPFDIPILGRTQLNKILLDDLDKILSGAPQQISFNKGRWAELFVNSLQHFFQNLRQTNRFLSTFSFHLLLFQTKGSLEVNPIDLITIETLRVFEPAVYRAIAGNKELLTSVRKLYVSDSARNKAVEQIVALSSADHKEQVSEIVKQLFPAIGISPNSYFSPPVDVWQRELRVASEDIFDRYFQFTIPEGDLSQSRIDALLRAANDRKTLHDHFLLLNSEGLLEIAIERLDAYKETISTEHALPFVTALFDLGDILSESTPGMFELSPMMHASRIIYWYLKLIGNAEKRSGILQEAIANTKALGLAVHFLMVQQQALAKGEQSSELLITPQALDELKALTVQKIRSAAANGELQENKNLIYILFRWMNWGNGEETKAWCAQQLLSTKSALTLLKAFTLRSLSFGSGDYVEKENWYVRLKDLERLVDLVRLDAALEKIETNNIGLEEEKALKAYGEAKARRAAGEKDFWEQDE